MNKLDQLAQKFGNNFEYDLQFDMSPLVSYLPIEEMENKTFKQFWNLRRLPFIYSHVAAMPDAHLGYGMPIGGVVATKGVIIPNAVGSDISCGVTFIRTSIPHQPLASQTEYLKKVMELIRKAVPIGYNHHKEAYTGNLMPNPDNFLISGRKRSVCGRQHQAALKQIGTLGGGNHFIELQRSDNFDHSICIMIHSGSRNLGYQVADHYNKVAKKLNKKWHTKVDPKWDLAFLPLDSEEGQDYIQEMNYCVQFAEANRSLMLNRVMKAFREVFPDIKFSGHCDVNHNFARMEKHLGEDVMVHRKGATSAAHGEIGLIPGSQGTKSYIVMGKGNPLSFRSCSHGAGRVMGRKDAKRNLDLETEKKKLDDQGIIHSIQNVKDLDEAPGAYKDIDQVIHNQRDLITKLVTLTPLGVIKA